MGLGLTATKRLLGYAGWGGGETSMVAHRPREENRNRARKAVITILARASRANALQRHTVVQFVYNVDGRRARMPAARRSRMRRRVSLSIGGLVAALAA